MSGYSLHGDEPPATTPRGPDREPSINPKMNAIAPTDTMNRRQAVAGLALALGTLAAGIRATAETPPPAKDAPGVATNPMRTSLHYEADFNASAQRIYRLLLDPTQFAALTGRPAEIDPKEGGAFSMFGGLIVGRNVELVPNQRIVQAWRPTHWEAGVYSIVKFAFQEQGTRTHLVLDHTGFPEDQSNHLDSGWHSHYLEPLAKFLT